MEIDRDAVGVNRVGQRDLKELEKIFIREFGDEVNADLIRRRIQRVRRYYYLLLPLTWISPWVKNLFHIYMIKVKNDIAGFVQISRSAERQWHLDFVAVGKKYRRQGLGSMALRRILTRVVDRDGYDMLLEVRAGSAAGRLYRRFGFETRARVLHYERAFSPQDHFRGEGELDLKPLSAGERSGKYLLYRASVPLWLQEIVRRTEQSFRPSMVKRNLAWLKDALMKNETKEYVLKRNEAITAWLEVKSYPKARYHIIGIMLQPDYEFLRTELLLQTLRLLQRRYGVGKVVTTVYDDLAAKQKALAAAGFMLQETYDLMHRPARRAVRSRKRVFRAFAKRGQKRKRTAAAFPDRKRRSDE